jgi:hypothetical protein
MQLLDGMILTHRLSEFVDKVIELYNEEKKEDMLWDIWLYRVHDKSYAEFVASVDGSKADKPTEQETAEIVKESRGIWLNVKAAPQAE